MSTKKLSIIILQDNKTYKLVDGQQLAPSNIGNPIKITSDVWSALLKISHAYSKGKMSAIKRSLVLFNEAEYAHNTDDGLIELTGYDAKNFELSTGNLIGYVKQDKLTLNISSRFGDDFLKYIIADADGFLEVENSSGKGQDDDYQWLLAYLWNIKLKCAYRLGLPKLYASQQERLSKVRGKLDSIDFYKNQGTGKYLCTYREHSYTNPAITLFMEAYKVINHYSFSQQNRGIYNALQVANQGIKRSRLELLNTKYFTNPFYNDYNLLIDLSKKIISSKGMGFSDEQETNAFLFDVSMLFEYFIRKLLIRGGFSLRGKQRELAIPALGVSKVTHQLEPDLVIDANNGVFIFDVKYKNFSSQLGVRREDLFQLHTYIGQYANQSKVLGCGFIYPLTEENGSESILESEIVQQGNKIPFYVLFLKVPSETTNDQDSFIKEMAEQCNQFKEKMHHLINT